MSAIKFIVTEGGFARAKDARILSRHKDEANALRACWTQRAKARKAGVSDPSQIKVERASDFERKIAQEECPDNGGHWEDNQGLCHRCGVLMNAARAEGSY